MSRVEPDTFINDRYAAIEDRLQVRGVAEKVHSTSSQICCRILQRADAVDWTCRSFGRG